MVKRSEGIHLSLRKHLELPKPFLGRRCPKFHEDAPNHSWTPRAQSLKPAPQAILVFPTKALKPLSDPKTQVLRGAPLMERRICRSFANFWSLCLLEPKKPCLGGLNYRYWMHAIRSHRNNFRNCKLIESFSVSLMSISSVAVSLHLQDPTCPEIPTGPSRRQQFSFSLPAHLQKTPKVELWIRGSLEEAFKGHRAM